MYARLRALERKLVHELAELVVSEHVESLTDRWRDALDKDLPTPSGVDFGRDIGRAGFPLPTIPSAINYLAECFYNRSMPDPGRLFRVLLPWCNYSAHAWA